MGHNTEHTPRCPIQSEAIYDCSATTHPTNPKLLYTNHHTTIDKLKRKYNRSSFQW